MLTEKLFSKSGLRNPVTVEREFSCNESNNEVVLLR